MNREKTGSHTGLNRGPLTLAVSALPPELWICTCTCVGGGSGGMHYTVYMFYVRNSGIAGF